MQIELTEEEINLIMRRRYETAVVDSYNQGIIDAGNIIMTKLPAGVARTEVMDILNSLLKELV